MTEWTVQIVKVRDAHFPLEFDFDEAGDVDSYLEVLADHAPAFAYGPLEYSVQISIDEPDPVAALGKAINQEETAAMKAGFPGWPIVSASVLEWSYFEIKLDEPSFPTVIGVSELAGILGVSRQRASELARSSSFPAPFQELASGPVWFEPTVRRFVGEWDRRPGRPRKVSNG